MQSVNSVIDAGAGKARDNVVTRLDRSTDDSQFVVVSTPDGCLRQVSDTACRVTGYARDELVGAQLWDLLCPGDLRTQVNDMFREFAQTGEIRDWRVTIATRSGRQRMVSWTCEFRRDDSGALSEVIGIGRDLTEQDELTRALADTRSRLAEAQRVGLIGIWEHDVPNNRFEISDEALAILDAPHDRDISQYDAFFAHVHEDDRGQLRTLLEESLARGSEYDAHYRVYAAGGIRHIHARGHIDRDPDGEPLRMFATVQDVTAMVEQKERLNDTIEELRSLKAYTEHVVENSPDFIVAIAPDGIATAINGVGLELLECEREDIVGADLWRFMYPGELYRQVEELHRQFERFGGVRDYEMTMRSARGNERMIAWTSVNRWDENGQLLEIVGIGKNVTELRASQAQLVEAQKIAGLGSWEMDLDTGTLVWSDAAREILGLTERELGTSLDSFLRCMHPEDRQVVQENFADAIAADGNFEIKYRVLTSGGEVRHLVGRCRVIGLAADRQNRVVGTVQDVTAQEQQNGRLQEALDDAVRWRAYHEHIIDHSPSIIIAAQPDGTVTAVNGAGCRILGCTREQFVGRKLWRTLCPGDKYDQVPDMLAAFEARGQLEDYETVIETFRGEERVIAWNSANRFDTDGRLLEAVGIGNDVTDLQRSQRELQFLAHHDPLTGLPNRLLLGARLDHAIDQALRRPMSGALLFIDLDRFKIINDSLGHPVGDALLKAASGRLANCVRANDTVARLSGDEFTLLLEDIDDEMVAVQVAEKVLGAFRNPFHMEGHEIVVTPSIGISIFPRDGNDIDSLLRNADSAMYEAKNNGRNGYAIYTPNLTDEALERVRLENDLRRAIDFEELVVQYQPQVDLDSGSLVGAEALVRWRHPEHGMVPPGKFIAIAEDSGLIIPIGDFVLRQACADARQWLDAGVELPVISVNVAGPQIQRTDLCAAVQSALAANELDASLLELEVTESFIMREAEHAIGVLDRLRELGVRLSIDDFGTGYSSLSYLKRLPIDQLKIDRSFVRDLPDDADDMAIAAAVIALARSLRLEVVAEGVETEEQRRALLGQGCLRGQGYLFSRPVDAADFAAWALARAVPGTPAGDD